MNVSVFQTLHLWTWKFAFHVIFTYQEILFFPFFFNNCHLVAQTKGVDLASSPSLKDPQTQKAERWTLLLSWQHMQGAEFRERQGSSAAGSLAPRVPGPAASALPGSHPRPTESTSAGQRDPQVFCKLEGYTEVSEGLAV